MAPHGKELSQDLRNRVVSQDLRNRVVSHHKDGLGYKKIGNRLNLSPNTVARIIQRFSKLNSRDRRQVQRLASQNRRRSAAGIAVEIADMGGQSVSAQTIRRTLNEVGLHGCCPRRKPLLKLAHKKARKQFAQDMQSKTMDYWKHILWSDETKFNLFGSDGVQHVWRRPGEEYQHNCVLPTVKHGGGSVMIWGCMSAAGTREMRFIEGIMDSKMYCDILMQNMKPFLKKLGRTAVFQHDNDPKHTSKMTTAFLKKSKVKVMKWPSMSPDLNPIEHLWGILKRKVEERQVSNIRQLREVIMEKWKNIPATTCTALVNSMPRRVQAVLDNNGAHTKY